MLETKQCTFINHKHDPHNWFDPIVVDGKVSGREKFHCEGKS
jgi:hypothetical protein